ncbi:glycosyltransferase [Bradyrhizobium sp. RDT46]|uniref:glycosyltransferase n=1 Tax=Bradyrhizobium sp. RDT46 TaxID=3341829 RepID=UPI0035C6D6A1
MSVPIAHILRTYGVHGGERQLAQFFSAEDPKLYDNTFFSLYRNRACDRLFETIPSLRLKTILPIEAPIFPSLRYEMLLLIVLLPILQLRLFYLLATGRYRVCVVHGVQAAAACWLAACFLSKIRSVYVHRGTKSEAGSHPIFKVLYRPYDVMAGVSVATAHSLEPLAKSGGPVITIENGINWQKLVDATSHCEGRKPDEVTTLISSARLLKHKAQAFLLDALAVVLKERANVRLIIAGDGPERENLMQQSRRLGIAGCVQFIGHVPNVNCWIVNSDIFVHASEVEGMSNAVLEAMALGLPSVVVDAPGVTECHIDGETGFVVCRSPEAMATRIAELIDDADLRRRMGIRARERIKEHYSIAANLERYHALYSQLLAAH